MRFFGIKLLKKLPKGGFFILRKVGSICLVDIDLPKILIGE